MSFSDSARNPICISGLGAAAEKNCAAAKREKLTVLKDTHNYADMIAVANDPLKDISSLERVDHVMKGGLLIR
jgi:hypothetical protein